MTDFIKINILENGEKAIWCRTREVKIDQSFVQDVPHDPNACVIARAIIALGQSLGLAVIAEGVETEEQRAFLESNGCRQYQEYLYSRPLPLKEFGAYVTHMQGKGVEVVDVKSPP